MFDPLRAKTQILLLLTVAFVAGMGGATVMGWTSLTATPAITEQPQVADEDVATAVALSESFVRISEAVVPAVVRIEADRPGQVATRSRQEVPEEFRRFFEFPPRGEGPSEPRVQTAGGSGFIVSEDGYILTNEHVVSGAQRIRVYLADRREYDAELIGTDPTTDVALVKIDDRNLPTLSFGTSQGVRVGEWVLAVGNPGFGARGGPPGRGTALDYTVTAGIISALGRPLELLARELERREGWQEDSRFAIEDFIQTDAVINPGNSGGPLVNVRGQVVGINSAIASPTGFFQGYGFAIPIDLARRVMEDLVEYGHVRRPLLGVQMLSVTPEDAEFYGLPRTAGALVQEVPADGPAYEAGIRPEDVIVAVDDQPVERSSQLQLLVAQRRPGDQVRVRVYRDGQPREFTVRLGEATIGPRAAQPTPRATRLSEERVGIQVAPLDEDTARRLGYESAGGVIIQDVAEASPAWRRGIRPAQRLLEINREPVETVEDVERLLGDVSAGDVIQFRLGFPDGASTFVNFRVPR
jgi:serine protease Do